MKVVIDCSSIGSGGGMTHVRGLVGAIAARDAHNEYWIIPPRNLPSAVERLPSNFHITMPWLARLPVVARIALEQIWLPIWLRRRRADVLFSTADRTVVWAPCPTVVLIQNLNPYEGPAARTLAGRMREGALRMLASASARRAARVIFVSEHARRVISRALGVPASRSAVIYHGVEWRVGFEAPQRAQLPGRRRVLLTVSVLRAHKDLPTLVSAISLLVRRPQHADVTVAVAAPVVDRQLYRQLRDRTRRLGLERFCWLGEVPAVTLPGLYAGASAFVFTSLVETFGLPLVEAMASGVPIVASDIPAAREVCGDAALYFSPSDPVALADRLADVLEDAGLADSLRRRGLERVRQFSWDRAAEETLLVLESAANGPRAMGT